MAAQESQGIDADYTVADCMRDYLEWFKVNRKSHQDTRYAVKAHILPRFGRRKASELTTRQIRKWHEKLALRNEDLRKGKSTANRVLTVFKAALNRAYDDGHVGNPEVWKKVKPFRDVDAPRERFLTVACGYSRSRSRNVPPRPRPVFLCGSQWRDRGESVANTARGVV